LHRVYILLVPPLDDRGGPGIDSQFDGNEYVIYDARQRRLEYLVGFKASPFRRPGALMLVRVSLVDSNPKMIKAWKDSFDGNPEVEVIEGSMLETLAGSWVTPTNPQASMDGGLDAMIKKQLGVIVEKKVQAEVKRLYKGSMPVGFATCVETGAPLPKYLISTPTMVGGTDDTLNVALACCAAFQMVHLYNAEHPGAIRSIALPGLGAAGGKTAPEICAALMWTAYNLFREKEFSTFEEMRKGLEEILGDLGTFGAKMKTDAGKASVLAAIAAVSAPKPDEEAGDFDDADDDDADEDDEDEAEDDDDEDEDEDAEDVED
jgi:O-acetyl-ADP-ribose deacetylase (regulator of RNase III)